ncbi:hypothetical protein EDD40_7417 [Saccharothrix texasensis]|uniref:Uncharacterized protein n=1 Tax=Saccharothrix texasensis TaxID=103734 RepID=A0A3N1HHL6_9PSEU|nr:hypothetical protein EDD40_7417 [Saccharothrix texasensis]
MSQGLLFGPDDAPTAKPVGDGWQQMRVLITVKAAPNPSETYGETVCVAGIRLDFDAPGWVRLYPINFRELDSPHTFKKYDIVSLRAKPARGDFRTESWRPDITSAHTVDHLKPWTRRRVEIEPYVDASMCTIREAVHANSAAPSLAAVRPDRILGIDIKPHPGWSPEDQRKIDRYVGQLDLTGGARTALQPPRFQGWYRYRCTPRCNGHRQGILDWEFVALQRKLKHHNDEDLARELRAKYLDQMCAPDRDTVFYVGNQAKSPRTFSVLGVYWPTR